jgi:hypothetical protein
LFFDDEDVDEVRNEELDITAEEEKIRSLFGNESSERQELDNIQNS